MLNAEKSEASLLKAKQRQLREGFNDALGLRVHRAISWLRHAELQTDTDGQFIFLWIAFNAAYSNDVTDSGLAERQVFNLFLEKIIALDQKHKIYTMVWDKYSSAIRVLLDNRYIFQPYWDWANGKIVEHEWQTRFEQAKVKSNQALASRNTVVVLSIIFERLYTLRNQMIHGGATHNSRVNRNQLRDATSILFDALPLIIDTMMLNPKELWGDAIYPVV